MHAKELDSGVGVGRHMGHMSPPQGTLRPKKTVRASRPMSSATSTQGGHRRIKSMSSASTDQMMLDYFRRDPNVALHELPDLGSMSMESAGMFTSEDWQEAFIQIGTENDLGAGGEGAPGVHMGHRKSADSSSFGKVNTLIDTHCMSILLSSHIPFSPSAYPTHTHDSPIQTSTPIFKIQASLFPSHIRPRKTLAYICFLLMYHWTNQEEGG